MLIHSSAHKHTAHIREVQQHNYTIHIGWRFGRRRTVGVWKLLWFGMGRVNLPWPRNGSDCTNARVWLAWRTRWSSLVALASLSSSTCDEPSASRQRMLARKPASRWRREAVVEEHQHHHHHQDMGFGESVCLCLCRCLKLQDQHTHTHTLRFQP